MVLIYGIFRANFLIGIFLLIPLYKIFDVDNDVAWPVTFGFLFSAILPVLFLKIRKIRSGRNFEEMIHYVEIKEGITRNDALFFFVCWMLVALIVVGFAIYQLII